MNFQITGKNFQITSAIRAYVEEKIGGLTKFNDRIIDIRVTLEQLREQHATSFKATAQLHISHDSLYTEEVAQTVYAAIDIVKDEMERQLRDWKERHLTEHRKAQKQVRALKSTTT